MGPFKRWGWPLAAASEGPSHRFVGSFGNRDTGCLQPVPRLLRGDRRPEVGVVPHRDYSRNESAAMEAQKVEGAGAVPALHRTRGKGEVLGVAGGGGHRDRDVGKRGKDRAMRMPGQDPDDITAGQYP